MSGFQSHRQRQNARALRARMTGPEQALWYHLRAHRFFGLSVRRQAPVGPWIADFLIPQHRLVIEIDGDTHDQGHDAIRDQDLGRRGYRVLRFTNADVLSQRASVLTCIAEAVGHRT